MTPDDMSGRVNAETFMKNGLLSEKPIGRWEWLELVRDGEFRVLRVKHWSRCKHPYICYLMVIGVFGIAAFILGAQGIGYALAGVSGFGLAAGIGSIVRRFDGAELICVDPEKGKIVFMEDIEIPLDRAAIHEIHFYGKTAEATYVILVSDTVCEGLFEIRETKPGSSPVEKLCTSCGIDYRVRQICG